MNFITNNIITNDFLITYDNEQPVFYIQELIQIMIVYYIILYNLHHNINFLNSIFCSIALLNNI